MNNRLMWFTAVLLLVSALMPHAAQASEPRSGSRSGVYPEAVAGDDSAETAVFTQDEAGKPQEGVSLLTHLDTGTEIEVEIEDLRMRFGWVKGYV